MFLYKVIRTPNDAISLSGYREKFITSGSVNTFYEIFEPGSNAGLLDESVEVSAELDKRFTLYYAVTNQGVGEYVVKETKSSVEEIKFVSFSDYWTPSRNHNKINVGIKQERYFSEFGRDKIDCKDFGVVREYKDNFDSNIKIHFLADLKIQFYPGFLRTTKEGQGISRLCKLEDGGASHHSMESTDRIFLTYKFLEKTFSGSSSERAFKDPVLWFNTSRINSFTSILGLNCNVNIANPFKDQESDYWKEYTWLKSKEPGVKGRVPFLKFFIDIKDILKIEKDGEELELKNESIFNFLGSYDAFFSMTSDESTSINSSLIKSVFDSFSKQKEFIDFVELHKKYFPYDKSDEIKGDFVKSSVPTNRSRIDTLVEMTLKGYNEEQAKRREEQAKKRKLRKESKNEKEKSSSAE